MRSAYTPVSVKISRPSPAKLRFTLPTSDPVADRSEKSHDRNGSSTKANCANVPDCWLGGAELIAVVEESGIDPDMVSEAVGERYRNRLYFRRSGAHCCCASPMMRISER